MFEDRSELHWERLDEIAEYRLLSRARLEYLVEVREPLVLISQIPRSGGTLVSQLFDNHPECHAHPHELQIGYPKKDALASAQSRRPRNVVSDALRKDGW